VLFCASLGELLSCLTDKRDSHVNFPGRPEAFAGNCRPMANIQTHWFSHIKFRIGGSISLRSGINFLIYLFAKKRKTPFAQLRLTRKAAQASREKLL
jgi:hypothetical protein